MLFHKGIVGGPLAELHFGIRPSCLPSDCHFSFNASASRYLR
jgi:hypothetical protein